MTIEQPEWTPPPAPMQPTPQIAAGWYPDPNGAPHQRYWDGAQWTGHTAPQAVPPAMAYQQPMYGGYPVPVQPNVRQSMDRAQYVRNQTGHSIILHALFGWALAYIPTIYYAFSPNHYFHA